MKTGERQTPWCTLPAYLNALTGAGCNSGDAWNATWPVRDASGWARCNRFLGSRWG